MLYCTRFRERAATKTAARDPLRGAGIAYTRAGGFVIQGLVRGAPI